MEKYIKYETAKQYLFEACSYIGSNGGMMLKIKFDQEPTIDISTGKWVPIRKDADISCCSNCESYWIIRDDAYDYLYCPKCGAKMSVIDKRWR